MDLYAQILAGVLVIALLGLALWALRRVPAGGFVLARLRRKDGALLESSERLTLTPQHAIHLVRLGDRAMVVAVHSGGCTLLESRPWQELGDRPARADSGGAQ